MDPRGMPQLMAKFNTYQYYLQPGDGTPYTFSMSVHDTTVPILCTDSRLNPIIGYVIPGTNENYVGVTSMMQSAPLVYQFHKQSLRNLDMGLVGYACSKAGVRAQGTALYTITMILLAVQILVDDPKALDGAIKNMARVHNFLGETK